MLATTAAVTHNSSPAACFQPCARVLAAFGAVHTHTHSTVTTLTCSSPPPWPGQHLWCCVRNHPHNTTIHTTTINPPTQPPASCAAFRRILHACEYMHVDMPSQLVHDCLLCLAGVWLGAVFEVDTCSWGGALHTLSNNQHATACNLGKVALCVVTRTVCAA